MTYNPLIKEVDPITREKVRKHFTDATDFITEDDISRIETGYEANAEIEISEEVERVIHQHRLTAHNSI